ncbi:hypothetical protein [Leifsonia poae]|uniref:NYN domain-containing protein n=1 Tax=Leifsonia poae TaxID=110933 RepID=A0A9W6H7K8_9MICO|nr:hypothetical protein [Leifsonia poae]GLJ75127.1 hypothetical protein GCM10017584_07000 [Leifsonia poae]
MSARPTMNVYVDGFNLYNGLLRGSDHRWLDLVALFDNLFPSFDVCRVRYFTANLKGKASPHDPGVVTRQQTYLRALATLDRLEIHRGHFEVRATRYRRRHRGDDEPEMVDVWRPEEKGSDVNLAQSHLPNPVSAGRIPLFRPAEWLPDLDRALVRKRK